MMGMMRRGSRRRSRRCGIMVVGGFVFVLDSMYLVYLVLFLCGQPTVQDTVLVALPIPSD